MKGLLNSLLAALAVCILAGACGHGADGYPPEAEATLRSIDTIIGRRHHFEEKRRAQIGAARQGLEAAATDSARYEALKKLCGAYQGYRPDSALNAASARLALARRIGDPEKITSATIILAQSHLNFGDYRGAVAVLDTLDPATLPPGRREQIYSVLFGSYAALATASPLARERLMADSLAKAFRDSVISLLEPGSVGHTYLTASRMHDAGMTSGAIRLLEEAGADGRFAENASFQYGLGMMYLDEGRADDALTAISRASLTDLADGKKEYVSLIRLARLLYDRGDILRAFNYIKCALEDVSFSHSEIRAAEIMEIMPVIDGAYRAYEETERERIHRNAMLAAGFGLLMALAMALLWIQLGRISRIKRLLAESNRELSLRNALLAREDAAKVSHIEALLQLHASNITHNKAYRRDLLRMLAAGQYSRASDRLKSDNVDNSETKTFYELFDSTFLSMFPDFIEEINAYMLTPFANTRPAALTPEQRIMALMKFGHSSTPEISAMLRYTQQTVYNYRSSIRGMLACSLEEFERKIRMTEEEHPGSNLSAT